MATMHWIKRERMAHKRGMNDPLSSDSERAVEYALWLAQRDGIDLPANARTIGFAYFQKVQRIKRARMVRFGGVVIELPHWDYIERGAVQLPDDESAPA
jgi:hypothetical protein